MTPIDSIILAAETKAGELQEAIAVLNAATQEAHGFQSKWLGEEVAKIAPSLAEVRQRVAEALRPKGPMVTLEWVSWHDREPMQAEVARRTEAWVFMSNGDKYSMKDGEPPGGKATSSTRIRGCRSRKDRWRISAADLDRIRAMPLGENEVSRALKAAEAAR